MNPRVRLFCAGIAVIGVIGIAGLAGCQPTSVATPTPAAIETPASTAGSTATSSPATVARDAEGRVIPGSGDPTSLEVENRFPVEGLTDVHTVNVMWIDGYIGDTGHAIATPVWWTTFLPCDSLDAATFEVDEASSTIHLTVTEGFPPERGAFCEIARLGGTVIDLGVLDAGSWTITAEGDAEPFILTVP